MTLLWQQDDGLVEVTSALQGVTQPLSEIVDDIHRRGWTVNKIHVKDGDYVAVAKSPHKETLEATGKTDATAAANLLVKVMRREFMRSSAIRDKIGAWNIAPIEQQLSQIAMAYAKAPVYEPKAAPAWMDLAQDCQRRAQVIRMQIQVEYTNDPVPYESANDMREDVGKKRHITITRAFPHHPLWSEQQMLDYRLVIDVLGHMVGGADWGWHGTCLAFGSLAPLLAESPQKALFTELLGQTAFGQFYRNWGPQKICFLDKLLEPEQQKENRPGHTGVHPSQSIVPIQLPRIMGRVSAKQFYHNSPATNRANIQAYGLLVAYDQGEEDTEPGVYLSDSPITSTTEDTWAVNVSGLPLEHDPDQYDYAEDSDFGESYAGVNDYYVPVDIGPERLSLFHAAGTPRTSSTIRRDPNARIMGNVAGNVPLLTSADVLDPNADWQSGIQPLPDNAYLWQRQEGVDPLDSQTVTDTLHHLESGVAQMHPEMAKQAVVNALRSSLLGSRTNPRGHAIHYQDLMHIPANVDDPLAYWDTLEQKREHWNKARGYAPESHKQHWPEEQQFKQWVKAANPQMDDGQVQRTAKRELLHMLIEEEERILAADEGEQLSTEHVEHQAYEALKKRLKALTKPTVDQKVDFGDNHLWHESTFHADMYPCVDEQSEILTRDGWRSIRDVDDSAPVATLDANGCFEWQIPDCYNRHQYNGPMYHFESKAVDACYSPQHDLIVRRRKGTAWQKIKPDEVTHPTQWLVRTTADTWAGENPATIHGMPAAAFVRLAAWYLTEGSYIGDPEHRTYRLTFSQSRKASPAFYDEIVELLTGLGYQPRPTPEQIYVTSRNLGELLISEFGTDSYNKRIPGWFKDLHPDLLDVFVMTMFKGDGDHVPTMYGDVVGRTKYYTVCKRLADDLQEIGIKSGWNVWISEPRMKVANLPRSTGKVSAHYEVSFTKHPQSIVRGIKPATIERYEGIIWCPTTANGNWFVRRNGKVQLTGNSYLASRIRPMAQVSRHAGELAQAAHEDLRSHKGHGHHFRAKALGLEIPQLGPRQVSHAWLHIAPQTSQLGVIDPQLMEVIGHDYQTDASTRDYFKHERELAAGRDAAGFGHIPLGPFSAGLWDLKVGGPGWHPDRTPFKITAPAPHQGIDWNAQSPSYPTWPKPYWWESTSQAREQTGEDFDRSVATQHSRDEIPFQKMGVGREASLRISTGGRSPWVSDPATSQRLTGAPGVSLMQHLKDAFGHQSAQEVWGQDYELGKSFSAQTGGRPLFPLNQPGTYSRVAQVQPPDQVIQIAQEMLAKVPDPQMLGDTRIVGEWYLETHTIGCRNAADTDPNEWESEHAQIHEDYAGDGQSTILYDDKGSFVTITPLVGPQQNVSKWEVPQNSQLPSPQ